MFALTCTTMTMIALFSFYTFNCHIFEERTKLNTLQVYLNKLTSFVENAIT